MPPLPGSGLLLSALMMILADDDDDFRTPLANSMGDDGCQVVQARSAEEALERATAGIEKGKNPHYRIVMDYHFKGGMDGYSGLKTIEHHYGSKLDAILVSGDRISIPNNEYPIVIKSANPETTIRDIKSLLYPKILRISANLLDGYRRALGPLDTLGKVTHLSTLEGNVEETDADGQGSASIVLRRGDRKIVRMVPRSKLEAAGALWAGAPIHYEIYEAGPASLSRIRYVGPESPDDSPVLLPTDLFDFHPNDDAKTD